MKTLSLRFFTSSLLILLASSCFGQTIAQKKASLAGGGLDLDPATQAKLVATNQDTSLIQEELRALYRSAQNLLAKGAPEESYRQLLVEINTMRSALAEVQENWRKTASSDEKGEKYALWQQPETTLEQLIIDYGSQDYVYLMSNDISKLVLSVTSNLPIPRASWGEMLETILNQNRIGIRQLNPYLRELYIISENSTPVKHVTNNRKDLEFFPREMRMAFLLSPQPEDVRRVWFFLDKFINPNTTVLQMVGRDILIISQVGEIVDLLKLHDFVVTNQSDREYRLIPLSKVPAKEMATILSAVFGDIVVGEQATAPTPEGGEPLPPETNILQIVTLESTSQALFLVGTREEINKAEKMIRDVESRFGGGREKTIYWYTVKHSNADELADVLEQIYAVMIREKVGATEGEEGEGERVNASSSSETDLTINVEDRPREPANDRFSNTFYEQGSAIVNPRPIGLGPQKKETKQKKRRGNFIVDAKTGAIVMVVEKDLLTELQEVLRKLDVPKKMVQIDVLLFEKKILDKQEFGLNLFKIGDNASNTRNSSVCFNDDDAKSGILSFLLSRPAYGGKANAFDLIYKFLMTQQDIQINSNPSVITVNQTPAQVAIVEERSINTGQFAVDVGNTTLKDAFTRAQYGINLEITPTIHMREGENEGLWDPDMPDYITLETFVSFDTVSETATGATASQPIVTRRNIRNEALIADGQTVILGGLRRKDTNDTIKKVPCLGDLPGLGKLFSTTEMNDSSTEMFIFLTPKILDDPCEDIERLKKDEMCRRPGDIPDFIYCLKEARERERNQLLRQSMQTLLGRPKDPPYRTYRPCVEGAWHTLGEYDGCR